MNGKTARPRRPARTGSLDHITIECVTPELDGGRYPVKRVVGDVVEIGADIFKDGHDMLAARVRLHPPDDGGSRIVPMVYDFNADRWTATATLDHVGRWTFVVEGWTDRFRTWRSELQKKVDANQDVSSELLEGAELIETTARRVRFGEARNALRVAATQLRDTTHPMAERTRAALWPDLFALMETHYVPDDLTCYRRELAIWVDRERARFAAWYELFPRSFSPEPGAHGTFDDAATRLPRLAELGYDVIYLPPIHPIGRTHRKGKNNTLTPEPDDVGSPWAIGNEHGGHDAIEPRLGTVEDFERFVRAANELHMEVALDFALQCSPDHPWVREHPEWFHIRPDGTIKYAENPPKKYQDIYPINFWCRDREGLWKACRDVLLYWVARGVKTFRVDNPHTKPFAFWEWVIAEVQSRHPDVIFFAEAFTRPKKLKNLAKLGFGQSYTYFTWKNTSYDLREFVRELFNEDTLEYLRGNLFANTPDILHEYLQAGGKPAFRVRLLLAATMSPLYGLYSGYELYENVPVRHGSEEYLDSEKYQIRQRDWEAPGNLNPEIQRLNHIRRTHRALQRMDNLTIHATENEHIFFFRKAGAGDEGRGARAANGSVSAHTARAARLAPPVPRPSPQGVRDEDLLVIANLDPFRPQETMVIVPLDALGIAADEAFIVEDLLTGARYTWRGARNYVRLDPRDQPGHLFRVLRSATA